MTKVVDLAEHDSMMFNGAQFHLLINHVPVVGVPIVLFAFSWGLIRNDSSVIRFSLYLYALIWVSTAISYFTGDSAEHVLKALPNFERSLIHNHEDLALWSFILGSVGLLPAIGLEKILVERFKRLGAPAVQKRIRTLFFIILFALVILLGITAHLGGLIRHTEIRLI